MMAKMTENVFGQAAAKRQAEQENIEQTIKTGSASRGRPPKAESEKTHTVSVRMTDERQLKLKMYAVKNKMSVSQVLADFIDGLEV